MTERQRERVRLVQSSLTYRDARIAGCDAAVSMEVAAATPISLTASRLGPSNAGVADWRVREMYGRSIRFAVHFVDDGIGVR